MVANQTSMIGPNRRPSGPVPCRWTMNRATMITRVIGITRGSIEDEIVSVPSTAESTEIAGVIMLSPKNSAAPNTPRPASRNFRRAGMTFPSWRICEISAMIPPSPWLSAFITSPTYLTVTISVTDQKIRETMP